MLKTKITQRFVDVADRVDPEFEEFPRTVIRSTAKPFIRPRALPIASVETTDVRRAAHSAMHAAHWPMKYDHRDSGKHQFLAARDSLVVIDDATRRRVYWQPQKKRQPFRRQIKVHAVSTQTYCNASETVTGRQEYTAVSLGPIQ
jgi:hypothetical protein